MLHLVDIVLCAQVVSHKRCFAGRCRAQEEEWPFRSKHPLSQEGHPQEVLGYQDALNEAFALVTRTRGVAAALTRAEKVD